MNQSEKKYPGADPKKATDSKNNTGETESVELAADGAASGNDGQHADALPTFVTKLARLEEQVGLHVINALQHPQTRAVLTTVASSASGSQQVVSIALDEKRFDQIQKLLTTAKKEGKRRVHCVGFHCYFDDDDDASEEDAGESGSDGE